MAVALTDDYDPEVPVIEAIRGRDHGAFEEFVHRQRRWVRSVIYGVLGQRGRIDDVEQNVWLAVWQRGSKLRDVCRWRPWLYRLARNAALDAGRVATRDRKRSRLLRTRHQAESDGVAPESGLVGSERYRDVVQAIEALPTLYREPFVMRHVGGWSYKQIAEVMDTPVDTVETRLVRARRFLRESLKDKVG